MVNELKDVLIQQVGPNKHCTEAALFLLTAHKLGMSDCFCQVKETSFLRNTISECQACGTISSQPCRSLMKRELS